MSNTPKIRFSGFAENWERAKLIDEVTEIIAGGDIDNSLLVESGKYPVIANALSNDGIMGYYENDFRVQAPAVTVTGRGNIGHAKARLVNFTPVVRLLSIKSKHDALFLENIINTLQIIIESTGVPQLTVPQLSQQKLWFPLNIEEENSIGELFEKIDSFIMLHQHEYEKLLAMKEACLNKMFPKNGSNTPEIRFSGFVGDWNQFKLGTMGTTFTGLSGKTKEDFGHGEGRFVTYMNVYLNPVSDIARTDLVEIDTSQNAVQYGDVFFTTSSETPEEVGMSSVWLGKSNNVYLNSFCFGFRPTMEIDPLYMAYMLRSEAVRKKIIYLAQGISRYNISKNRVMEIEVPLPDLDEQKLIGQYFNSLDKLIALHQCKLEKFKQVKQSMLHNMFV